MVIERILPWLGSFRQQVVLVTGASSGIGRSTALTFARQGAAVALAARRREQLEETAAGVASAGGRPLIVTTDVTDVRSVRAAVSAVRRKWGRIDCLVNNAGVLTAAPVMETRVADLEAMFRVNFYGALLMMQAVVPLMQRQRRGTIINVASLAGRRGFSPLGGYSATKFALVGLTEALRTELDPSQIHVGLVMPGVVDTPMAQQVTRDADALLAAWPAALNMPAEWVAAAIVLAARFRLREISVPPGAATLEVLAALAPAMTDTLIGWTRSAAELLSGNPTAQTGGPRPRAAHHRRTRRPRASKPSGASKR